MQDFEKLGLFYLGRPLDTTSQEPLAEGAQPLLYDSRDLVTHAVCVGMTGSGKTGLCLGLLEEAAIDGVPAVVIDPKGDLANLLLTFPDLQPADFAPWVQPEEARRKELTVEQLAENEAKKWKEGLAAWGQDGERIRRLRAAADFRIFTPGSTAGEPVSILASFAPPPAEVIADAELLAERIESTATGLLGLVGLSVDPLRSREHILLSSLLDRRWREGTACDLASLIADVQKPPLDKVGVLPLESFYPAKERFELAMSLNALLAAPGFEAWLSGTPLDLRELLRAADGRPRISVISIAHLSDAERMFFVTLLLNQALAWMRAQAGTGSLRAILYMDEIFGFLPPTANPPSKKPFLTLLKQARAFGLGLVVATQNPVDLDYKALSNIGTWFLGRLQTERDVLRVLDGLEGASGGGLDRAALATLLAGLASRRFLLHNVHEDAPVLFETRWAMSYLSGPLTRDQIRRLRESLPPLGGARVATPSPARSTAAPGAAAPTMAPVLPDGIAQRFVVPDPGAKPSGYRAALLGEGRIHFSDAKAGWTFAKQALLLLPIDAESGGRIDWSESREVAADSTSVAPTAGELPYGAIPAEASRPKSYSVWKTALKEALYRGQRLELYSASGIASRPGESERDFRARLADSSRERRDAEVDRLKAKLEPKVAQLRERLARAEAKVEEQKSQASARKLDTVASAAGAVFGALFGRRKISSTMLGKAASTVRSYSRQTKESRDVELAEESVGAIRAKLGELEREMSAAVAEIEAKTDAGRVALEKVTVAPKKADVEVIDIALAWRPV
jgi:hypothetical protein